MPFKKKINTSIIFYLIIISIYSFFITFYYADFGVFPIDTFLHYDAGYRILKNEYPIKDYWIVTGFLVDFLQAIFFKVFGVSWFSYKIHSSTINLIVTIFSFYFFLNLNFNYLKSLIYSICFATLGYTVSGTPFVDFHASFFLVLSTFAIIIASNESNNKFFWFVSILLLFFSFLSKQVPIAYAAIIQGPIIISHFFIKKDFSNLKFTVLFSILLVIIFFAALSILNINFSLFFSEYIQYPREIGSGRFDFFNISFESFFNKFKFILIPIVVCTFFQIRNYMIRKKSLNYNNLKNYLLILTLSLSLLFHQLMTKNQIFIYFLIPLLFGILDQNIDREVKRGKKYISLIIIATLIFITFKYHLRFNETRKFHELENVNFNQAIAADKIHASLKGNLWINAAYQGTPSEEIKLIKSSIKELEEINEEILLITNYLFIDSISKKNMNLPSKAFTLDGTTYPRLSSKMSIEYKNFLFEKIEKKKINKIYFIKHENLSQIMITEYIDKNCFKYSETEFLKIYEIKCLK